MRPFTRRMHKIDAQDTVATGGCRDRPEVEVGAHVWIGIPSGVFVRRKGAPRGLPVGLGNLCASRCRHGLEAVLALHQDGCRRPENPMQGRRRRLQDLRLRTAFDNVFAKACSACARSAASRLHRPPTGLRRHGGHDRGDDEEQHRRPNLGRLRHRKRIIGFGEKEIESNHSPPRQPAVTVPSRRAWRK